MARLIFYKNNEELLRYQIQKQQITIGRSSYNDICLPDQNISRVHASLELQGKIFLLADRSTNGTSVNGQPVLSHPLADGDRIEIGDWQVLFQSETLSEEGPPVTVGTQDPTQILAYDPKQKIISYRRAYLVIRQGAGRKVPLAQKIIALGKHPSNHIILADEYVSNFHCRLEVRGDDFFIKDLNSTNGTFVNGQRVVETSLSDHSLIRLGQTDLEFLLQPETTSIEADACTSFQGLHSRSKVMQEIFALIRRVAHSEATVLILGETGTGKELVARAIHQLSNRRQGRFVPLNCGAIARDILESELFGHEKGAFTSANAQRKGAFEYAQSGTLFLDEIAEIPYDLQASLLRALESREIKRVGGNELIDVDVRLIAATNADLADRVTEKKFREDLFHRLYIVPIQLPRLRERQEDIPLLVEVFLQGQKKKGQPMSLSEEAMNQLLEHNWPGNIRELKNTIDRAMLCAAEPQIEAADITFAPQALIEDTHFDFEDSKTAKYVSRKSLAQLEKDKIALELAKHHGNKAKTAEALGMATSTLFEKIKKYGLSD